MEEGWRSGVPIYEYFCEPCDGVFELIRPVQMALEGQPCPQCDADAKRIVSRQWSAFTVRDGLPRRLPDTGGYWHFGKRVSTPVNGPSEGGYTHPELTPPGSNLQPATLEEIEGWEHTLDERRAAAQAIEGRVIDSEFERTKAGFVERLQVTRGAQKVERAKRRLLGSGDGSPDDSTRG